MEAKANEFLEESDDLDYYVDYGEMFSKGVDIVNHALLMLPEDPPTECEECKRKKAALTVWDAVEDGTDPSAYDEDDFALAAYTFAKLGLLIKKEDEWTRKLYSHAAKILAAATHGYYMYLENEKDEKLGTVEDAKGTFAREGKNLE